MREPVDQRRVLICFSPKNRDGKELLADHLAAARRSIKVWSVDDVCPGQEVLPAFLEEAGRADAALLILSVDFLKDLDDPMFARQVEELRQQQERRGMWIDAIIWRLFLVGGFFELTGLKLPWGQKPWDQRKALTAMSSAEKDEAMIELVISFCHSPPLGTICGHAWVLPSRIWPNKLNEWVWELCAAPRRAAQHSNGEKQTEVKIRLDPVSRRARSRARSRARRSARPIRELPRFCP